MAYRTPGTEKKEAAVGLVAPARGFPRDEDAALAGMDFEA